MAAENKNRMERPLQETIVSDWTKGQMDEAKSELWLASYQLGPSPDLPQPVLFQP